MKSALISSLRRSLLGGMLAIVAFGGVPAARAADGSIAEQILSIVGPALTPEEVSAQGPAFDRFEREFIGQARKHMASDTAKWENSNYYDRAKIFYTYFARTGNSQYLEWANQISNSYQKDYIEKGGYGPSAHWLQITGMYLHYLISKDPSTKYAIRKIADLFSLPYYLDNLGDVTAEMDNRMQARTILALLFGHLIEVNSDDAESKERATLFADRLRGALDLIAQSQAPDGAYRFVRVQCGFVKPFMIGLLNDALIDYYNLFEKDPRIPQLIGKSLDYLWNKAWDEDSKSFVYLEGPCGEDNRSLAGGLNGLLVSGFGFMLQQTGDEMYRKRGDAVFEGAVATVWLDGSKQFNQAYLSSYRYPAYRAGRH